LADSGTSEGRDTAAPSTGGPLLASQVAPFYLVSVPYTGTRFVQKLLRDNGLKAREEIHTHVEARWPEWFEHRVLVPMRDPILHAITCVNLGREHRLRDFDVLAGLATADTHFFRVDATDTDDRDARMIMLAAWLNLNAIRIDWTPEGQSTDKTGLKADYLATGEVPDPSWLDAIGWPARAMLRGLGYRMKWLEA
jgi:hypothetical protein